MEQKLRT